MFGQRSISLASFLILSSKVFAQIPAAFTSGFNPKNIELEVKYDSTPDRLIDGQTLDLAGKYPRYHSSSIPNIAPDATTVPKFALGDSSAISKSSKYIILMIDPDSPSRDDDTSVQVLHYLKTDFAVTDITNLGSTATAAMPYAGPDKSVGTGPHRYIFLLYDQPITGFMNVGVPDPSNRTFSVGAWKTANNLKAAVAGIHFVATPPSGGVVISSAAAAETASDYVSTAWEYTTTAIPCTSTAMWTVSTSVPVASAAPVYTTATLVASPVGPAGPAMTHKVIVGGPNLLTYQPSSVEAAVGDVVEFDFLEKNHTVTQSTFDTPCVFNPAGVKSGFRPNPENILGKEVFTFTVADVKPKWFFCAQAKHCQAGMVFAINPGTKFPEYLAKATGAPASAAPSAAPSAIPSSAAPLYPIPSVATSLYPIASSAVAPPYPVPTTLVATGTGGLPIPTGNVSAPGATTVPIFTGAASGRAAASWALVGAVGLLAFFL